MFYKSCKARHSIAGALILYLYRLLHVIVILFVADESEV